MKPNATLAALAALFLSQQAEAHDKHDPWCRTVPVHAIGDGVSAGGWNRIMTVGVNDVVWIRTLKGQNGWAFGEIIKDKHGSTLGGVTGIFGTSGLATPDGAPRKDVKLGSLLLMYHDNQPISLKELGVISEGHSFRLRPNSTVYLGMNDSPHGDNSGFINVEICNFDPNNPMGMSSE